MKRKVLGCIALLCSSLTWAENGFSIDDFTIKAGEEKIIAVKMHHDVNITAFQFELFLPEGVSIKTKKSGKLTVTATNRLSPLNEDDEVVQHNLSSNIQTSGGYRIMAYSNESLNVAGDSGDPVVTITIVASDQISTGAFTPQITNMEMTEANGTKHKINPTTYNCSVTLETTVTTLGYASFSWPKALDFTNSGLTAYIATSNTSNSLHLESVTKVPANTGLILKGTAGSENTYPLQTTEETTDDVTGNMLASNTTGAYTVASDNVYVLSNLDNGKPGLYLAGQGIQVGQYKSYLVLSTNLSRRGLVFDEGTTGINGVGIQEQPVDNHIYNLNGQRLQTSAVGSVPQKGIYIMSGKKRIVR